MGTTPLQKSESCNAFTICKGGIMPGGNINEKTARPDWLVFPEERNYESLERPLKPEELEEKGSKDTKKEECGPVCEFKRKVLRAMDEAKAKALENSAKRFKGGSGGGGQPAQPIQKADKWDGMIME